jgi:hypothetical protein
MYVCTYAHVWCHRWVAGQSVILHEEKKKTVSIDRQADKEVWRRRRDRQNERRRRRDVLTLRANQWLWSVEKFFWSPDEIWNPVCSSLSRNIFKQTGPSLWGWKAGEGWFPVPDWWPLREKNLPVSARPSPELARACVLKLSRALKVLYLGWKLSGHVSSSLTNITVVCGNLPNERYMYVRVTGLLSWFQVGPQSKVHEHLCYTFNLVSKKW